MKNLCLLAIAVTLYGLPSGVAADGERLCLAANGERYQTRRATCPPGQEEVKKKVLSCVLPDGSRSFGDKCPAQGAEQQALDAEQLSNRSKGAGKEDIDRANRGFQKLTAKQRQEQMQAESIAAQRRAQDAQEQSRREMEKRQEERRRQQEERKVKQRN